MDLPNLSKQQRWYIHQWCDCWNGILYQSSGDDPNRILHIRRRAQVFRRQLRDADEQDADDAPDQIEGSDGEDSDDSDNDAEIPETPEVHEEVDRENSGALNEDRREEGQEIVSEERNARTNRIAAVDEGVDVGKDRSREDEEDVSLADTEVVEEVPAADINEDKRSEVPEAINSGLSSIPVEHQQGVDCLKHSLNNILLSFASSKLIIPEDFEKAASQLNQRLSKIENISLERFSDRNRYAIKVAEEWLQIHLSCCRINHSMNKEKGDGERIIGVIVRPSHRDHFLCYRMKTSTEWEQIDSINANDPKLMNQEVALAPGEDRYYLLHQCHNCDHLLDLPVAAFSVNQTSTKDAYDMLALQLFGDDYDTAVDPVRDVFESSASREDRASLSRKREREETEGVEA